MRVLQKCLTALLQLLVGVLSCLQLNLQGGCFLLALGLLSVHFVVELVYLKEAFVQGHLQNIAFYLVLLAQFLSLSLVFPV